MGKNDKTKMLKTLSLGAACAVISCVHAVELEQINYQLMTTGLPGNLGVSVSQSSRPLVGPMGPVYNASAQYIAEPLYKAFAASFPRYPFSYTNQISPVPGLYQPLTIPGLNPLQMNADIA